MTASDSVLVGGDVVIDGALHTTDVHLESGRIARIGGTAGGADSRSVVDCTGLIVAPGFIDLQCNGAGGVDLTASVSSRNDAIERVAAVLPRFGITSFLPTVVTSPRPVRDAARDAQRRARQPDRPGAVPLGLHFEGPMISHAHRGAHTADHLAALSPDEVDDWVTDGTVSMVTLAPEFDGALEVIDRLHRAGIVVSAGHTESTVDEFEAARRAGVTYVTHLFNAMAPLDHRSPGPIGATLASDDVVAGLICDGIHVDPVAVAMAWKSLGHARLSLVSDAAAPLGAPFGRSHLGGVEVISDASGVRTAEGVLAGSALALDAAVRNLVAFTGCSLVEALATVTTTPADLLGLIDRGRVAEGSRADLVLLDRGGNLMATIVEGETVWKS